MPLSKAFVAKFFALAALLFALWSFAGFGDAYGRFVIALTAPFIETVTECRVTAVRPSHKGLDIVLHRRGYDRTVPLQPREAFSGIIPFLSLMIASASSPLAHYALRLAIGLAIFLAFHFGLMFLGTFLTGLPQAMLPPETIRNIVNPAIDVIYAFYGLVGYAALPFLLWFWLARPPARQS